MAFKNSGYIIVDQDPNLEAAIQGTQIPLLAILDDGVNPISRWSFDSNAVAGSKWTNMGTNHPTVTGGLSIPTFSSAAYPLGSEFLLFAENGNLISSHISNGIAWALVSEVHPETISGTSLPTWSSSTHKIGTVFLLVDSNGIMLESYISNISGWVKTFGIENKVEIPSYAFAEKLSPSISELRSWVDSNLLDEDKNKSLLYLDVSKTYTQGSVETMTSNSPGAPNSNITKITTSVNGVSIIKNCDIDIIADSVNVYSPSEFEDAVAEELLSLGASLGDLIITDNSYDGTDWTFEYSNIGNSNSIAISIMINSVVAIDGGASTATIVGGNSEEPSFTWDINKDEITRIDSFIPKAVVLTGAERTATNLADVDSDKGKIIFNEDTENLEYWNGTSWVVLSIV